jgi:hypothetical protein
MSEDALLQWLQDTAIAQAIPSGEWLFPAIETVHVLSLATVFGSILMVDLRLLGVASRAYSLSRLTRETLPYTWIAFGTAGAVRFHDVHLQGTRLFSQSAVPAEIRMHAAGWHQYAGVPHRRVSSHLAVGSGRCHRRRVVDRTVAWCRYAGSLDRFHDVSHDCLWSHNAFQFCKSKTRPDHVESWAALAG